MKWVLTHSDFSDIVFLMIDSSSYFSTLLLCQHEMELDQELLVVEWAWEEVEVFAKEYVV